MADKELKRCQEAGQKVETRMREELMNFIPAHDLKVNDVLAIAGFARRLAFDAFYTDNPEK